MKSNPNFLSRFYSLLVAVAKDFPYLLSSSFKWTASAIVRKRSKVTIYILAYYGTTHSEKITRDNATQGVLSSSNALAHRKMAVTRMCVPIYLYSSLAHYTLYYYEEQ